MSDNSLLIAAAFIKQLDKVYRLRTPIGYLRLVYRYGNTVEAYLACHDRKDAKRQAMDFSTWIILSRRKKRKYEPFV